MNKCNVERCELEVCYLDKCVLHCPKDHTWSNLNGKSSFESAIESVINKELLASQESLILRGIHFTNYDFKALQSCKSIVFDECSFYMRTMNIHEVDIHFHLCAFEGYWDIENYTVNKHDKAVYSFCHFKKPIECDGANKLVIDTALFHRCEFEHQLVLENITFNEGIFNNVLKATDSYEQKLRILNITNCIFDCKSIFNQMKVDVLDICDSEFKGKFEFKNNNIKKVNIKNTNFLKLFDSYGSEFNYFRIFKSIFEKFAGFENNVFSNSDTATTFKYVTFLDFTNFRGVKFNNGLDLETTNLQQPPNFLNSTINEKNTNRETYRIIKHSFDEIGNQLEANKYFSYEMKKYKEELKKEVERLKRVKKIRLIRNKLEKKKFSKIRDKSKGRMDFIKGKLKKETWDFRLYNVNDFFSSFGENFLNPVMLMLLSAVGFYCLTLGYEFNLLYRIHEPANGTINFIMTQLNNFAKGIPPYGKLLKEGMEFVTLLFHIFFLVCTWQFIVAVKRRTKR
tara:strand:+ start:4741 stop:6273 length:1533 start_codon:yes stop_codon:yes gene_type:complete